MTEHDFSTFLRASFELMQREFEPGVRRIAELLAGRDVVITIDGCSVGVFADGGRIVIGKPVEEPAVVARSTRAALSELLEARTTLVDAVWNDRVFLRGKLEDLVVFYDTLDTYFRVAVRCPTFPALLDTYLGRALQHTARSFGGPLGHPTRKLASPEREEHETLG